LPFHISDFGSGAVSSDRHAIKRRHFMGLGVTELFVILAIVLVLFGTKRLRNIGGDLGSAIKSFRSAMSETDENRKEASLDSDIQIDKKDKQA
jgi:sec-independent protein translocase protein TatA